MQEKLSSGNGSSSRIVTKSLVGRVVLNTYSPLVAGKIATAADIDPSPCRSLPRAFMEQLPLVEPAGIRVTTGSYGSVANVDSNCICYSRTCCNSTGGDLQ